MSVLDEPARKRHLPCWLTYEIVQSRLAVTQAILEASQLKNEGQTQRVIVTGCLAQRYSDDLAGEPQKHSQMSEADARRLAPIQKDDTIKEHLNTTNAQAITNERIEI